MSLLRSDSDKKLPPRLAMNENKGTFREFWGYVCRERRNRITSEKPSGFNNVKPSVKVPRVVELNLKTGVIHNFLSVLLTLDIEREQRRVGNAGTVGCFVTYIPCFVGYFGDVAILLCMDMHTYHICIHKLDNVYGTYAYTYGRTCH
jgi:hypothetical protein